MLMRRVPVSAALGPSLQVVASGPCSGRQLSRLQLLSTMVHVLYKA